MGKNSTKLLSWLLILCMVLPNVLSSSITVRANETGSSKKELLWSSSFETPDDFTPNKLDKLGSANMHLQGILLIWWI